MAKRFGSRNKLCLRVGQDLYLKSMRPAKGVEQSTGKGSDRFSSKRSSGVTRYGEQLIEKQKLKFTYGLMERQFRRYFKEALRLKGATGINLLVLVERRLDNIVYQLGWSLSRPHARQLVSHRFFEVNGKRADVASYRCSPGDVITVAGKKSKRDYIAVLMERNDKIESCPWITVDGEAFTAEVLRLPERSEIQLDVKEQDIVELCSR